MTSPATDVSRPEPILALPRSLAPDPSGIRRLLVCVDRSPFSEACLAYAIAISKTLASAITLLYVMQPPHEGAGAHATDVLDWEIASQEARAYLERLQREAARLLGRPVEIRLEQGHAAERITAVARETGADVTVLGSHGEHGVTAWTMGSTALQVLAVTRASVLIVRSGAETASQVPPKRILVPLDGSLRSESVLPTAVRIAGYGGGELLLVFVVHEPVPTAVLRMPEDLGVAQELAGRIERSARRYLEGLRERLEFEGGSVRTLVLRSADEKHALLEVARTQSDLVVLCAHGSTCNPALTGGSVTLHLLVHSTVPLLVLQDLRDTELREKEAEQRAPPLRASFPEDA